MEDAAPIEILDAGDVRHAVDDAGGDEKRARLRLLAVERHREAVRVTSDLVDLALTRLHAVARDLLTSEPPQLRGQDAISRDEGVHPVRRGVAVLAGVTEKDPAAAPAENERRAEPRGPSADDDRVVHVRWQRKHGASASGGGRFSP